MINLAGVATCDETILQELREAGITPCFGSGVRLRGEVPATIMGQLCGWEFVRAWYYWVFSCNDPTIELPFKYATPLHNLIGDEVRVAGHCGCPSPEEWYKDGKGCRGYHIDSQEGLNILASTLRKWQRDRQFMVNLTIKSKQHLLRLQMGRYPVKEGEIEKLEAHILEEVAGFDAGMQAQIEQWTKTSLPLWLAEQYTLTLEDYYEDHTQLLPGLRGQLVELYNRLTPSHQLLVNDWEKEFANELRLGKQVVRYSEWFNKNQGVASQLS